MAHRYLIALGSNIWHPRFGAPRGIISAAFEALADAPLSLEAASPIIESVPLGPSRRRYANATAVVESALQPEEMLAHLQGLEASFGRKRRGRRWGARVLDLDIVLWTGGIYRARGIAIPHPEFRRRLFVLGPARSIAHDWRDPLTGLTVRHLAARIFVSGALSRCRFG